MAHRMEKYTRIEPVVMQGAPDAHHVFLQWGKQRFCVTPHGCETMESAEWVRETLCTALEKIVRDVSGT